MQKFKKLSKTLLMATALTVVMVTASTIPDVAELSGLRAVAQETGVASQARADAATAARAGRPRITSTKGMTERPAKVLTKAQEMLSEEPPRFAEAKENLLRQRIEKWNTTEQAAFYQIMASIAGGQDDLGQVLVYYKKLLGMDGISYTLRDQLTYNVGQIEFSQDNKQEGTKYLYEWLKYQPAPSISQIEFFANVHYSLGQDAADGSPEIAKNYHLAIEYLNWAVSKAKVDGKDDKENWYQVLRALHNSLEETAKVLEYAELLATRWPKKNYWVELSNLYAMAGSEVGLTEDQVLVFEKKQFSTMELAHRQGMLDKGRELETMSQLYLYHDSPYQAAKTMSRSFSEGASEVSRRNLELHATSYINGKDLAEAVEPLSAAAEMSDDGNNYMRLANVYLNLDKYEEAASAIDKALNKGGLSRPDQSSLMQGQAYLSLEQFDKARTSFREAAKTAKDDRTKKMSRDLLRYVDSEEKRIKDIKEYLS
ncbi:MAG: tetratricopeptide repeat protein [Woeseiaceae bacterium]